MVIETGKPIAVFTAPRGPRPRWHLRCPPRPGMLLSKWSCPELARELAARRQVAASASTVCRWLTGDALKPWQHRSWISVQDLDFALKAARVLDPYAGRSGFAARSGPGGVTGSVRHRSA